ncbi:MAG: hypothetical protein JEY96_09380 [Bacteroidales bacterium]|nr:hypothetical protein [Bacteroidales bacterium]
MKFLFASIILLFLGFSSFAQDRFDVFYVAGNYNFMQDDNLNDKNYEAAIMSNLSIPIVFKDSSVWYTSVDYQYFYMPNQVITTGDTELNFNLHGIILRTGYIHRFNSKQSLQVLFTPRYMSDFNASFEKSIQLGGIVMYEKIKNADFMWRIGVLYNQEFFGTYIVPVLYLDWNLTSKFKIKGLLPVYAKAYIQANENTEVGLHFIGLATSYRVDEPMFENAYVDRRSIDLSLFTNVHLWDNIFFEGRVGYSVSKDYGLYDEDDKIDLGMPLVNFGDDRVRLNQDFDGSPFVHLRLKYCIPVN